MPTRDELEARDDLQDTETQNRQHSPVLPASAVSPSSDRGRKVRHIDCSASAEYRATQDPPDADDPLANRLSRDASRGA